MKKASIDLGTNTALLLIIDSSNPQGENVIMDRSTMVRLGKGVDSTKRLSDEAMDKTLKCLKDYVIHLNENQIKPADVIAVTTATARDAENGKLFFDKVFKETGIQFKTLTGKEEAEASFKGGIPPHLKADETLLFDLGGGSLEFQTLKEGISLNIGSIRFTERYLKSNPVSDEEFWKCREEIDLQLTKAREEHPSLFKEKTISNLVGVAGTVVTLACLHLGLKTFDRNQLDACVLTRGDLHRLVEELKWRSNEERLQMPGMEKGREDVILAGALTTWRICEIFGFKELRVSTRGLRYGVLL